MGPAGEWSAIAESVRATTGKLPRIENTTPVGGGCINRGFCLRTDAGALFVKLNDAEKLAMFEAEAAGLEEIAGSKSVRVPRPICTGTDGARSWLVLEFLRMGRAGSATGRLGEQLATMHRTTRRRFGWERDNTIGSTPQVNTEHSDWISFWRAHRIGYQLRLAQGHGYGGALQRDGERLLERLPAFFDSYTPVPSLLHGDLWGGNAAVLEGGEPVIFDPAVYYGDREADLAMTELFGGFSPAFYSAYRSAWPLDAGYGARRDLYNLYHVLNHLNLFGGRYLQQAQGMIARLLAEVK
jgi:fructosamine-3-kinase